MTAAAAMVAALPAIVTSVASPSAAATTAAVTIAASGKIAILDLSILVRPISTIEVRCP